MSRIIRSVDFSNESGRSSRTRSSELETKNKLRRQSSRVSDRCRSRINVSEKKFKLVFKRLITLHTNYFFKIQGSEAHAVTYIQMAYKKACQKIRKIVGQ